MRRWLIALAGLVGCTTSSSGTAAQRDACSTSAPNCTQTDTHTYRRCTADLREAVSCEKRCGSLSTSVHVVSSVTCEPDQTCVVNECVFPQGDVRGEKTLAFSSLTLGVAGAESSNLESGGTRRLDPWRSGFAVAVDKGVYEAHLAAVDAVTTTEHVLLLDVTGARSASHPIGPVGVAGTARLRLHELADVQGALVRRAWTAREGGTVGFAKEGSSLLLTATGLGMEPANSRASGTFTLDVHAVLDVWDPNALYEAPRLPAPAQLASALDVYAQNYCDALRRCAPAWVDDTYDSDAACRSEVKVITHHEALMPASGLQPNGIATCATSLSTMDCDAFLGALWMGLAIPCQIAGELESGTCAASSQCAGGGCSSWEVCGSCYLFEPWPASGVDGADCEWDDGCRAASFCEDGTCVPRRVAGERCADFRPCNEYLGLYCSEVSGTCLEVDRPGPGEACDESTFCAGSSVCIGESCIARNTLGAECIVADDCAPPATCVDGKCVPRVSCQ